MDSYSSTVMYRYWDNLEQYTNYILLTCPNSDTLLCYSNDLFLNSVLKAGLINQLTSMSLYLCVYQGCDTKA